MVLRDGMKANRMTIGHTSNTKNWMKKWFYINQNLEGRAVPCDVTQIPVYNTRWSDRPSLAEMTQVNELIAMVDFSKMNGVLVASTFVIHRIQPLRERVNFMFEYQGKEDPSEERKESLEKSEVTNRLSKIFENFARNSFPRDPVKPFELSNPPPAVCVLALLQHSLLFAQVALPILLDTYVLNVSNILDRTE